MDKKNVLENDPNSLKGVRIQTLSLWMVVCTILVSILSGIGIINVMKQYRELEHMTNEYILAQNDVTDMAIGSDRLTEEVRLYVLTQDSSHADAYFKEAEVTKHRDNSLEKLAAHLERDEEDSLQLLEEALGLSNDLMEQEIHAMKLTALSSGADMALLSPKIQNYQLPEEELQLTSPQMSEEALDLVFGPGYRTAKQAIEDKISSVTESVISTSRQRQQESDQAMKNSLIRQVIYTMMTVVLVTLAYIMISILILRPIRIYINCIKNNNILKITGAYEFKYLALTYNNIFEMSAEKQDLLRQKAEQDALTGLENRAAFESLKSRLRGVSKPIALLLLDVDVFKSINDTYGHETGDRALIWVAALLRENFRSGDHIFRIGGDEFAIIMKNIQTDQRESISAKINNINWILRHPEEDLPQFSVSVGVAFSANGYQDEIFGHADQALYHTKENGRCGCSFYSEEQEPKKAQADSPSK